jgi:hypothetical protein
MTQAHPQATAQPDRYVSFCGIDCDRNARLLMDTLDGHLADASKNNVFWDYFQKKRRGESGPRSDELFLIHCHINQIREFLEEQDDDAGLALLTRIEEECC